MELIWDTCVHSGDVDGNQVITTGDAQSAFQIALGIHEPTETETCTADCNNDAMVTVGDAQQIFMCALGTGSCADEL